MKYVVDTSIINKLVDGSIHVDNLPSNGDYLASHIQIDEINKTKDEERRARLFLTFSKTIDNIVPTESVVIGLSRIEECKIGDGESYQKLKDSLDALNKKKSNNANDALIAEVALKNGYTLITADYHMYEVAQQHDVAVHWWATS